MQNTQARFLEGSFDLIFVVHVGIGHSIGGWRFTAADAKGGKGG